MPAKISSEKLSKNEEDYLKALFYLTVEEEQEKAGTNQLAECLDVSPASVSGMVKKLKAKKLVSNEKYGKLELTKEGITIAVKLIRKHRLWETFLYKHMNFSWDEVHDVAEQLEHIHSEKLILELDRFLGNPKVDPHGDVIPDKDGKVARVKKKTLAEIPVKTPCKLVSVKDNSVAFLQYVTELGLALNTEVEVLEKRSFDSSLKLTFNNKTVTVSKKFSENVFCSDFVIPISL